MAKKGLDLTELCRPAFLYFFISMIAFILILVQNIHQPMGIYAVGDMSCPATNKIMIFGIKFLYIFFWTWVLDLICKAGFTGISWFLVLLPLILFFLLIGLFILSETSSSKKDDKKTVKEGMLVNIPDWLVSFIPSGKPRGYQMGQFEPGYGYFPLF